MLIWRVLLKLIAVKLIFGYSDIVIICICVDRSVRMAMPHPAQSSTMYHVTTHTALTLVPSVSPAMPVVEGNDTSVKRERTLMEIPVSLIRK